MTSSRPRGEPAEETAAPPQVRPVDRGFVMTLVGATAVILFLYMVRQILLPFVAAAIVAFVCYPITTWLSRRLHAPRQVFAAAVFALLAGVTALIGYLSYAPVSHWLSRTVSQLPTIVQSLIARLLGGRTIEVAGKTVGAHQIAMDVSNVIGQILDPAHLLPVAGAGVASLFAFLVSWVLLLYFLVGGPRIAAGLLRLTPPPHRATAKKIGARLAPVLRRYFVGVAIVVVYASSAAYLGLGLALHLKHAPVLAVLTGFLEIIPVVGPGASAVIAGLAAVQQAKSAGGIIAYIIYAIALRLSIDQLLGPLVLGRAARLHPTAIIFCFLSGALLFGVVGVVLAVPVALSLKVTLTTIYGEHPDDQPVGR